MTHRDTCICFKLQPYRFLTIINQTLSIYITIIKMSYLMFYHFYFLKVHTYPAENESDLAFAKSIEPGQPALPCSLTRLYTVG